MGREFSALFFVYALGRLWLFVTTGGFLSFMKLSISFISCSLG